MRVQRNDHLATELLSKLMEEIEEDRSGQHPSVTDLMSCLTKSYFNLISGKLDHTLQTKVFFLVGLGLERALLSNRKEKELYGVTEDIHWHVDSQDEGLIELKSTRAGPKKHLEGEFSQNWLVQTKSYCKAIGVTEVDVAVVYLIQADFIVYHVSFDQEEIDSNWEWMLGRKEIWDKAVESKDAPASYMFNQDWECKKCQYKIVCDVRTGR